MSIYHDIEAIKSVAISYAKEHKINYNIILVNPNELGNFCASSTYEFVTDSYFDKPRKNVKLLYKTDDLIASEQVVEAHKENFPSESFMINEIPRVFLHPGFGGPSNEKRSFTKNNRHHKK